MYFFLYNAKSIKNIPKTKYDPIEHIDDIIGIFCHLFSLSTLLKYFSKTVIFLFLYISIKSLEKMEGVEILYSMYGWNILSSGYVLLGYQNPWVLIRKAFV